MSFQPEVGSRLTIVGKSYSIGAHPNAPSLPYGQEGRQGTVYLLEGEQGRKKQAMKVFRGKFVNPSLAHHSRQISTFADVSGLSACERVMVTPQTDADTLHREPDLLYAVVMPWIEGPTWMDVMLNKQALARKQAYAAAFSLVQTLVGMEQRGLAHCDLSGPNVMLPMLGERSMGVKPVDYVQLIDLEQMYASHLERPEHLPGGSPGYAPIHLTVNQTWSILADRFAGAVLIAEMLSSCFAAFYDEAWGESYFAPDELQRNGERISLMIERLRREWGDAIATLLLRAWESSDLSGCPTFGEWSIALSKSEHLVTRLASEAQGEATGRQSSRDEVELASSVTPAAIGKEDHLRRAKQCEDRGKFKEALEHYRAAKNGGVHPSVLRELDIAIAELDARVGANQEKSREQARKLGRAARRGVLTALIVAAVGIAGYYGYVKLKDVDFGIGGKTAKPETTPEQYESTIDELKARLAEKEQVITLLEKQTEELGKPMDEKSETMRAKLSEAYENVLAAASTHDRDVTAAPSKTFEAASTYLNVLYASLASSYNLDEYFAEQTKLVSAYYYPYLYNENRNAQLNVKFFEDYKLQFEGGGTE